MTKEEAIEFIKLSLSVGWHNTGKPHNNSDIARLSGIKAIEHFPCPYCKHYDENYGDTCLNPNGTCRMFEYEGFEPRENNKE